MEEEAENLHLTAPGWPRRKIGTLAKDQLLVRPQLTSVFRESNEESEESGSSSEEEESEEEEIVSSDEEEVPAVRSYAALMQTLTAGEGPQAKRRKLNNSEASKFQEPEENDAEAQSDIDHVEEDEEGPETAVDGLIEDEDGDEEEDSADPFEAHFASPDENDLATKLRAIQQNQWSIKNAVVPKVSKASIALPGLESSESKPKVLDPKDLKLKQKLANVFLKDKPNFSTLEKTLADPIFNYRDLLFCGRTPANAQDLRRMTCLHAVNHVFK